MQIFLKVLVILPSFLGIYSAPTPKVDNLQTQNDTLIAPESRISEKPACTVKINSLQTKAGINSERYRWRNGFNVHPDKTFTPQELKLVTDAIKELSKHLCIKVKIWPQNSTQITGDYVEIIRGATNTGCWSYLGRQGGRQDLNLQWNGPNGGCIHKHVVQHELIHALGFDHEQNRPDRDSYVNIFLQNIQPQYRYAFNKQPSFLTFGVPYDPYSIMHYNSRDFSSNGLYTILGKNNQEVGSLRQLTTNDIQKLKKMYKC